MSLRAVFAPLCGEPLPVFDHPPQMTRHLGRVAFYAIPKGSGRGSPAKLQPASRRAEFKRSSRRSRRVKLLSFNSLVNKQWLNSPKTLQAASRRAEFLPFNSLVNEQWMNP